MEQLEEQLSYKFRNPELLQQALTHNTLPTPTNSPFNTRKHTCDHLKVIGDCVIKLLTSQYAICVAVPNERVHKIVKCKDNLSNRYCQNMIGKTLGLEEKGIVVTNLPHDQIPSHLDTFVKSLFGAIFLDAGGSEKKGFFSCWKVFLKLWKPMLSSYGALKPLVACFPEPKYSSREFLKERFNNFKMADLKLLEEKIGFKFLKQPYLLEQAMTHDTIEMFRSATGNVDPNCPEFAHFQTLEFLGDSVLELVIMEYLYLRSTSADPLGQMLFFNRDTGQKLYSSKFQIQVANKLKLGEFVIKPPQVGLANYDDFVESLIGSIFVHGRAIGLRACKKVVLEMWGLELEPSLEEEHGTPSKEDTTQKVPENSTPNRKVVKQPPIAVSTPPPSVPKPSTSTAVPLSTPSKETAQLTQSPKKANKTSTAKATPHDELQTTLGYKFSNANHLLCLPPIIDVSTEECKTTSTDLVNTCKNLQVIGAKVMELVIAEYVIRICHSTNTADLSAEMKEGVTKLMHDLASDDLLQDICARFQLTKFFNFAETDGLSNPITSPRDVIHLIFGAIMVDSPENNYQTIQKLFLRFWRTYINGVKPEASLIDCFPDTSVAQLKFRVAINAQISNTMWQKMFGLLGHTFTNKNLLEQALTDEKSQGYAKQFVDAYPLANPFGLQILGKCVIDLYFAQRCYLNTMLEPEHFPRVLERFDQGLFNTLKSRFYNLEHYYANHSRYPFPPKKNPRAPYETMFAAVYLDVGGGMKGMEQISVTLMKNCPTLLTLKKPKGPKQPFPDQDAKTDDKGPTVLGEVNQKGEDVKKRGGGSPLLPSNCTKSVREEPDISFGSPENVPPIDRDDPVLAAFHTKLAYKFVNPLFLKMVLDFNIPADDDVQMASKTHFEVCKILGKRALNLLITEFALESVSVAKDCDLSCAQKQQVEVHRKHLTSPAVINMIANSLQLKKYAASLAKSNKTPSSNEDVILALIGTVYVDSRANYLKISTVFNKLWKSSITPTSTESQLKKCFPITAAAQIKLRTVTNTLVADSKWKKIYAKLGYTFKNRNLLEQALTDEGSQEVAKLQHNAYPTGNPFGLRLLGRCVTELAIAYKTLPVSLNTPVDAYEAAMDQIEKALFNSFKNNFLGTEKYYACINLKKKQKFPPPHLPFGPYEAMLGAIFVDSGMGNPGIDTVGTVIVHRNVGLKKFSKPSIDMMDAIPISPVVKQVSSNPSSPKIAAAVSVSPIPEPVVVGKQCVTSLPSTSSASESLNTSFSSKCAANFAFSPVQPKESPPKPVNLSASPLISKEPIAISKSPVPPETNNSSPKSLTPKSPKKQPIQPTNTYASVLVNGQPVQTNNKLVIAVTKAQSQIQALSRKQETKDHYRKLSIEKEKLLLQHLDVDQMSNASSSSSRSRCPSTSTVNSKGSLQQLSGQKRKRGKGGKKQNKKAKAATPGQQQPIKKPPQELKQSLSPRVSEWCQNQAGGILPSSTAAASSSLVGGASSCTAVHQQRSMLNQPKPQDEPKILNDDADTSSQSSSPTTHAPPVPVNMVSGYRKSVVDHDGYDAGTSTSAWVSKNTSSLPSNGSKSSTGTCNTAANSVEPSSAPAPPEDDNGVSLGGVLKWTALILGVAFFLKRYGQGK